VEKKIKEAIIFDEGFGVVYERIGDSDRFGVFADGQLIDRTDEECVLVLIANNPEDKVTIEYEPEIYHSDDDDEFKTLENAERLAPGILRPKQRELTL